MKTKYELKTWKLVVFGEFENDEEAIKELSDSYLKCSKCDLPGDSIPELLNGVGITRLDPAKHVYLFVEHEVFGIKQMVQKSILWIYPSKKEHWWNAEDKEIPTTSCRYSILDREGKKVISTHILN